MRGEGGQQRRVPLGRDPGQLVGGAACGGHVAAGEQHLDVRRQQPRPRHRVFGLVETPAERAAGLIDATLRQP